MTIGMINGGKREKALRLFGSGEPFLQIVHIFTESACNLKGKELKSVK